MTIFTVVKHVTSRNIWLCEDLSQLAFIARQIIDVSVGCNVWLFQGAVGAGKTTLIQTLGVLYGIEESITSPTFSLINEYHTVQGQIFYHFDLYRLKSNEEALDIGIDEYIDSGHLCWIEWPDHIKSLLYPPYVCTRLEVIDQLKRRIEWMRYD